MTVTDIQLPVGAEATLKRGDVLNLNMTQTIKVSNGNVFTNNTSSKRDTMKRGF